MTRDPDELAYVAAARWPGFVKPVLDKRASARARARESHKVKVEVEDGGDDREEDDDEEEDEEEDGRLLPDEDGRAKLLRAFKPTFATALEALYPRLMDAAAWATSSEASSVQFGVGIGMGVGEGLVGKPNHNNTGGGRTNEGVLYLPRMARFVLVAAFLASHNPAKTDLRMFGRSVDERRKGKGKRKQRRGGGGAVAKVRFFSCLPCLE